MLGIEIRGAQDVVSTLLTSVLQVLLLFVRHTIRLSARIHSITQACTHKALARLLKYVHTVYLLGSSSNFSTELTPSIIGILPL